VASGRFRKLEREGGPRPDEEPLELEAPPERRREPAGDVAPPAPIAASDPTVPGVASSPPSSERHEPGFGTVLASGVLVACIMALVSIPVRRIFDATGAQGSDGELVALVVSTLGLYWSVRRRLRRL
jgi:hypothetical protein